MKLDQATIEARLRGMPGWSMRDASLVRVYPFASFPDAVTFATRLAFDAEARDHHPDLLISYRRVTVTWTTHSEGGLTEKDFAGAAESDRIASAWLQALAGPGR
jgi:4a-hydroxytetrahydrobiopterin dehydratase